VPLPSIAWHGDQAGSLRLLDQTQLPSRQVELKIDTVEALVDALRRLAVRGAPAIGIAAAYGCVLAARQTGAFERVRGAIAALRRARPTAVNLFWALDRMAKLVDRLAAEQAPATRLGPRLLEEARAIHAEDAELCERMGEHGAALLRDRHNLLTHCNTGRLATGGIGTALGVIVTAARQGMDLHVLVDETRPLLQGARLTMFELAEAEIPHTLVADGAAPGLIARGEVDAVLVGADRIAANGDVANKVGTLALALAADLYDVPFYVVAPTTSVDPSIATGTEIPIEERSGAELLAWLTPTLVPAGSVARNPAFDVTPARLVTALVTEHGVSAGVSAASIKSLCCGRR